MTAKSYIDVLVIGAGPSGLMSAYGLAKAGLKVKIVDQRYVPILSVLIFLFLFFLNTLSL
jgi:flavin-dependent dehydrogenase